MKRTIFTGAAIAIITPMYSDGTVKEYTSFGYKYIEYNRSKAGRGYMFGGFWLKVEE